MPKGVYTRTESMRVKNQTGNKNHMWKGNDAGYSSLHKWVVRHKGRAEICEHCGDGKGRYEWASITSDYKRDLGNWVQLCSSCHGRHDNIYQKIWATRRKNGTDKGYRFKRRKQV